MSARGSLVTNPGKKSSKMISESKRYIPLLWFGFLSVDDCGEQEDGRFELDRNEAVARAEGCLPFLTDVFSDIRVFAESATAFLERLKRLRCKTIGIDIAELIEHHEPPNPDLRTAIETIEKRTPSFTLSLPGRTVDNPFITGKKVKIKARKITSTREMLLEIAWLKPGESLVMPREMKDLKDEQFRELVTGYVWE